MDSEMRLGTDIANTVVRLAKVRALVHWLNVPDHKTLALVSDTRSSHWHVTVVLAPQNVRLGVSTDHAIKVHSLSGENCLVLGLLADERFHC